LPRFPIINQIIGGIVAMPPQTLRLIAIGLVLFSLTITLLRLGGVINWDLGVARYAIFIIAIALLLLARRTQARS
jgi:hypothetical protein